MYLLLFTQFLTPILCLEHENYDYNANGMVVANIKRRDTIPLQQGNRRWLNSNNLSYRKTKDIREENLGRHFEITQSQIREAQREENLRNAQREEDFRNAQNEENFRNAQINEIREDRINSREQLMGSMRNPMQARGNDFRNGDMRENKLSELSNLNYNQNPNYHNDPLNEINGEQLRKTKREIIEDKMRYMEQARYNKIRNAELRGNLPLNYNPRNSKYNGNGNQQSLNGNRWHAFNRHDRM